LEVRSAKKTLSRWKLVANGSWLAGQEFPIHEEGTILGRSKDSDVTIPGTHLSRQHVHLTPQGGRLRVRDLDSVNGTFINEERVTDTMASSDDILRVDVYSFRIVGPQTVTGKQKAMQRGTLNQAAEQSLETILAMKHEEKKDYSTTEWVTKPTSVGNRTHNVPANSGRGAGVWLAVIIALVVVGGLAYYFVR